MGVPDRLPAARLEEAVERLRLGIYFPYDVNLVLKAFETNRDDLARWRLRARMAEGELERRGSERVASRKEGENMRGAVVVTWGPPLPGREVAASASLERTRSYFAALEKKGIVGPYVELASLQGSTRGFTGMAIVPGDLATITSLQSEPSFQAVVFDLESAHRDFSTELAIGGEEDSIRQHEQIRERTYRDAGYL